MRAARELRSRSAWGVRPRPLKRRLYLALALTVSVGVLELMGGLLSHSLALLSDAGHMLADVCALLLSIFAIHFATLPATPHKTYGYYRLEILSALANGIVLGMVSLSILREAWKRLATPRPVATDLMLWVAVVGLCANLFSAWLLHRWAHESLNVRGAYLHVLGDALSSVGVVASAVLIRATGESRFDPAAGMLIAGLVLWSALRLVRDAVDVLLEASPRGLHALDVSRAIQETREVVGVHDLHVWSLTTGVEALSAHVLVEQRDLPRVDGILEAINDTLRTRFGIEHTTIQVESRTDKEACQGHAGATPASR